MHKHKFIIPLTDFRGEQDGRYACECGLVKPESCFYITGLSCKVGDCQVCKVFKEYERKGIIK